MTCGVACVTGDGAGWGRFGVAIGVGAFFWGSTLGEIFAGVGSTLMIGCACGVWILVFPCLVWVFGLGVIGDGTGAT